jgi:hypothetical protein
MEDVVFVAILVGLIEMIKKSIGVNSRWIPLIGFALTMIILGTYIVIENVPISWDLLSKTIIMALAPLGLYSGVKKTIYQ